MSKTIVKIIMASLVLCLAGGLLLDLQIKFLGSVMLIIGGLGIFIAPVLAPVIDEG